MGGGGKYTSLASTPLPMWQRPAHRRRSRLSLHTLAAAAALCFITGVLLLWRYSLPSREPSRVRGQHEHGHIASPMLAADALRAMYTDPDVATRTGAASCSAGSRQYSLLVVADQDEAAMNRTTGDLQSTLRLGVLCESPGGGPRHAVPSYSVSWLDSVRLRSRLSLAGRGMELSTLTWFGDRLLSCDDRTGIVYEIGGGSARPRHILSTAAAGGQFKCEWAAVRRGLLYIGGIGRPFRTPASADSPAAGPTVTGNDMVVSIDTAGALSYHNFSNVYAELCRAAGCGTRGYATHEAAAWVDGARAGEGKWVFAPRRVSTEPFDEALDEGRGGRSILEYVVPGGHDGSLDGGGGIGGRAAVAHFERDGASEGAGGSEPRGVSSIRLLPGSADTLVALKTEEVGGRVASFLSVVKLDGTVLMRDVRVADGFKFEGLEVSAPSKVVAAAVEPRRGSEPR